MKTNNKGFVTLTVTLMLLLILAGVALSVGKVMVTEQRISDSENHRTNAFFLAESGLDSASQVYWSERASLCETQRTLTLAMGDTDGDGVPEGDADDETVSVSWECHGGGAVTISAEYHDIDTGARARVQEAYDFAFLFDYGTPPPLTLRSANKLNGTLDIGADPNGGGNGVPVSVWAGEMDEVSGDATTCGVEEMLRLDSPGGGIGCGGNTYTEKQGNQIVGGQDLVIGDPNFPDDLFAFVFGIPVDQWQDVYQRGAIKLDSCNELGPQSTGIFVYEGTGSCSLDVAGSLTAPVIVLSVDNELKLNAKAELNGIAFSLDTTPDDGISNAKLSVGGGATIFGSVMGNHNDVGNVNGAAAVTWHPDIFETFAGDPQGVFKPLVRIAGSWRDF